jgi:hypothetical protein
MTRRTGRRPTRNECTSGNQVSRSAKPPGWNRDGASALCGTTVVVIAASSSQFGWPAFSSSCGFVNVTPNQFARQDKLDKSCSK